MVDMMGGKGYILIQEYCIISNFRKGEKSQFSLRTIIKKSTKEVTFC